MACSRSLTCTAWNPMKPPSLAASAAAWAAVTSQVPKAAASSAEALAPTIATTPRSSSSTPSPGLGPSGLKPLSGFSRFCAISWMSSATSESSCSRDGGFVAFFSVAIDSLAVSIGPPGSASEMARPATSGARRTRVHSSSVKSVFVVTRRPGR